MDTNDAEAQQTPKQGGSNSQVSNSGGASGTSDAGANAAGSSPGMTPPHPGSEQTGTLSGEQLAAHDAYKRQHDEKAWAMLCHLSVFAATLIPFGNIFGPLIVWLIKREEYALVNDQGKESLNFQISMTIYSIILVIVMIVSALGMAAGDTESSVVISIIVPLGGLLIIGLVALIFVIVASVKSYQGERYRYPLTIRFIS